MNDSIDLSAPQPGSAVPESSPPGPSVPPQASVLRKIFIGSDGLRAGWSLIIFILIVSLLFWGVSMIANRMHLLPPKGAPMGEIPPSLGFFTDALPFLMTFVATWIMSKIEKRPNSVYGLCGQRALANFFGGLAWGVNRSLRIATGVFVARLLRLELLASTLLDASMYPMGGSRLRLHRLAA